MEKRTILRVQNKKKKPTVKTIKRKKFLNKVLDYLKSDSYMFAPLIFSPPPLASFAVPKSSSSSLSSITTGVEKIGKNNVKGKRLLEKARDYMLSNPYMYNPLCIPQPIACPQESDNSGEASQVKRVVMEISTKKLIGKENQLTVETSNVTLEDHMHKGGLLKKHFRTAKIGPDGRLSRAHGLS